MASVKREGNGIEKLLITLETMSNLNTKVGWFPGAKYEDGTSVAYVATIQEYGSTHTHPGGTKYVIGEDGKATFVKDSFIGPVHGVTKPHTIMIPPRPFMRPTIEERKKAWQDLVKSGSKAVLAGNSTHQQVMTGLGLMAEGDIKKKITEITSPPLKAGTVRARMNKLAEGKKVGNLTKPLVESSLMLTTLTHAVEQT